MHVSYTNFIQAISRANEINFNKQKYFKRHKLQLPLNVITNKLLWVCFNVRVFFRRNLSSQKTWTGSVNETGKLTVWRSRCLMLPCKVWQRQIPSSCAVRQVSERVNSSKLSCEITARKIMNDSKSNLPRARWRSFVQLGSRIYLPHPWSKPFSKSLKLYNSL